LTALPNEAITQIPYVESYGFTVITKTNYGNKRRDVTSNCLWHSM